MRVWRIARHAFPALDGEGARLYGGRWSAEGTAVVYASSTLALAALEYLVHLEAEDAPADLVALALDVPDGARAEEVRLADLPSDWNTRDEHPACLAAGAAWAGRGAALLLRVPSAIVPEEQNVLLNPGHPAMPRVRVAAARPFAFDPRLLAAG